MTLELETIPCLADNYAFLVHDRKSGATALFDAPEPWPIQRELERRDWQLTHIFLTHHHVDHIDAVEELVAAYHPEVIGAARDAHRLPPLHRSVGDGDSFTFAGHEVRVLDVSGHTVGHIAYHVPDANAVFTADSLMALGCGRVFEGTMPQMLASLSKLAALPSDTIICSGHEYTEANGRFAMTIEPDNPDLQARVQQVAALRAEGKPTVPTLLSDELATNPFLRAGLSPVKSALHMQNARDEEVFAEIRKRKDSF